MLSRFAVRVHSLATLIHSNVPIALAFEYVEHAKARETGFIAVDASHVPTPGQIIHIHTYNILCPLYTYLKSRYSGLGVGSGAEPGLHSLRTGLAPPTEQEQTLFKDLWQGIGKG